MPNILPIYSHKKPTVNRFYSSLKPSSLRLFLLVLISISFTGVSHSQQTKNVLSFAEAINKTLEHSPELKSFTHQYNAYEGKVKQSTLASRKEIDLNLQDFAGSDDFAGVSGSQTTLSVSWVLEKELLSSRYNLATRSKELITNAEKIKQVELANETAQLFIQALALQEQVLVINQAIEFSKKSVSEINKKVSVGKSFAADLLRAEAELAKQQLIAEDLEHEILIAYRSLSAQWGEQSIQGAVLIGSLDINKEPINFDSLMTQLNQNPQITKLATLEKINEANIELAVAENKPRWKFMTGLRRYERTDDVALVAGFTLSFGGKNRSEGRIEELKANMSEETAVNEALKVSLQTSLYAFYQLMNHNVHLAERLSNEIIPKLSMAQVKTNEAYLLGRYGYLDLKNVQDDLIDAQLTLLEAKLNFHLNKIAIEAITGTQLFSNPKGM